jgi:hypothetical protein
MLTPDNNHEAVQQSILGSIEEFEKNNPEIVEAMGVMNMSMVQYLTAMESVRGGQSVSYSSSAHIPIQHI